MRSASAERVRERPMARVRGELDVALQAGPGARGAGRLGHLAQRERLDRDLVVDPQRLALATAQLRRGGAVEVGAVQAAGLQEGADPLGVELPALADHDGPARIDEPADRVLDLVREQIAHDLLDPGSTRAPNR